MNKQTLLCTLVTISMLCWSACDDSAEMMPPAGQCTDAGSLCMTVHVPTDFAGTPVGLQIGLYTAPPLPPSGPPMALLPRIDEFAIAADTPYELQIDGITAEDEFYVYAVLYMEGSTGTIPLAGVDYHMATQEKYALGGSNTAVNVGDIMLTLVE